MITSGFNISAVERDTGLSKDVLRVWERRYGFPLPERDPQGERLYSDAQIERLRLIKRLMDQGYRPGKLIPMDADALLSLTPKNRKTSPMPANDEREELLGLLELIKQNDANGYQEAMHQRLARQGLEHFVQDTIAPLTREVGEAWEDGRFEVFEEHLFTELTKRLLRQSIVNLPNGRRGPRIILTSVPDEQHILGLLMVEVLLALEGAECVPLGTQMPVVDIARAAVAHQVDVVALSFSAAFPARQIPSLLQQLRTLLPESVALWVGGAGVARLPEIVGVLYLSGLEQITRSVQDWREIRQAS